MAQWFVMAKKADFNRHAEKFGISPLLARIIRNRDIVEEEEIEVYLNGGEEKLYSPFSLKDMEKAVTLLLPKIKEKEPVRIIGDYDIDGICATYILLRGLKSMGGNVDAAIPHRVRDGYGLSETLMEEAGAAGIKTVVTCDNGIAAAKQIAYGNEMGITTIVTDHHEVPFTEEGGIRRYDYPPAAAIVNPKQEECNYPYAGICGAVVAYKLVQALFLRAGIENAELLEELLEFAAFATVGDVMELRDENRIIVKRGLLLMEKTKNTGLGALFRAVGIEGKKLSPYHIGFVAGPCLNATGRLDTAVRALELLQEENPVRAAEIAMDLKELNEARKALTLKGTEDAEWQIVSGEIEKDKILVVYLKDCHESLAGIIAGRMREKFGKPCFVLTPGEESGIVKGSGRSVEGYDMYAHMSECKELFLKFGGHKLAAGLSMQEEKVDLFRNRINELCKLTEEDLEEKIHIDIALPLSFVTEEFINELERLEPFGVGNSKPVFAQRDITVLSERIFGKNRNVGKYKIRDGEGKEYELTYFGDVEAFREYYERQKKISICYYPSFNEYMGKRSIQIIMQNYK